MLALNYPKYRDSFLTCNFVYTKALLSQKIPLKFLNCQKMTVVDKLKQKVSYKAHIFVYLGLNI